MINKSYVNIRGKMDTQKINQLFPSKFNSQEELLSLLKNELLRSFFDLLKINFCVIDINGRYLVNNNNIAETFSQSELRAQDVDLPSWQDCLKTIKQGKQKSIEEEYKGNYFHSIKQPFFVKGQASGIIVISFNITEQKKQERVLAQAKQNEEDLRKAAMIFAGSVAHDLTTPLTNINLMANNVSNMLPELLKIYQTIETNKQNLNETQLAYLEKFPQSLQTQLTELNEYIKDSLKALNKTVAGIKTQDDLVKCELWRCMQKVIDEYPYLENEKDLIHWDRSHLFNFMGNPLLFYRIMFNLIKNSLYQIREKGRGEIFIRAEQTDTHNVLYFKDTAGGVTQDIVDNIFNSYQTSKAEGTGVGLAFCKLTMQSFGGEMDCRLVDGEFIEFGLYFTK